MEAAQVLLKKKASGPWRSGSFYLIGFLAVVAAIALVGHLIPIWALPIALIGGILALAVIGAFQLRQDEKLDQGNFLKLMALSLRYLPWVWQRQGKAPRRIPNRSGQQERKQ